MTREEELSDIELTEEEWLAYLKWCELCNLAAEEQYREEQREVRP